MEDYSENEVNNKRWPEESKNKGIVDIDKEKGLFSAYISPLKRKSCTLRYTNKMKLTDSNCWN